MENKKNTITLKINSKQFKEIPMERTYKEELDLAMEHKINVLRLNIAYQTIEQLNGYWWFEEHMQDVDLSTTELYESICQCVYHMYLEVDNTYSLADIIDSIIRLHFENKIAIKDVNIYMVIGYIQDNF